MFDPTGGWFEWSLERQRCDLIDASVRLAFAAIYGRPWRDALPSTARDMRKRQCRAGPNGFDIDVGSPLWDEIVSVRSVFAELAA